MIEYACIKHVRAFKILCVDDPVLSGDSDIRAVGSAWIKQHKPEVGGYYVVHPDGYTTYKHAKSFQKDYTPS